MVLIDFLLFVALGCVIGFLAGLFGVGGGILMVPVLIFSYDYAGISPSVLTHVAIGTSLFVVLFASVSSAYQHRKQHNIDWRAVLLIGLFSALTAFVTTRLAAILSGRHLRIAFALVVVTAGIRMLTEGETQAQKKLELSAVPSSFRLALIGITAGIVSALAGVGGGVITIPMMYYLVNMPLKLAIGTSSAAIFITAAFSVAGYILNGMGHAGLPPWSLGFVDLQRGAALAIGSLVTARVGASVSFRTHPYRLRKFFALFIICVSLYMLLK
ncbi:MAG: hypothetical protein A2170_17085 [Deltaproteobacteria bacterium RBG_13_53_10]|nr:MAG: hypothetical protein A2170_17085 [Deltaproteobacteria bacterium RBG_13_53_10]